MRNTVFAISLVLIVGVSNATTISDTTFAKIRPVDIKDSSILVLINKYMNYKQEDCAEYLNLGYYTDYYCIYLCFYEEKYYTDSSSFSLLITVYSGDVFYVEDESYNGFLPDMYYFYYADNLVVISGDSSSRNRRAFERFFYKQTNKQPLKVKTKNINTKIISEGGGDVLWDILYKDDKYYVVWKECFSE